MIRKLRGRTLAELQDRGAHVLRVLADRRGWFVPTLVAGEVAPIVTPWAASQRALDGEALVMLPDAVRNALVARADLVCADRFPLLGHAALDYGSPPDWQRDPVSGMRAPMRHWSLVPYLDADVVGDHKVTWEVNRHQWLLWLAQAWRLTGDARYPRHAATLLGHWLGANPPKDGMNWASALEVAFRLLAWTHALPMLEGAPGFDEALRHRLASAVLAQADHLEWNLSTWFSPNTHLTGEALALLASGVAWPALPGARRRVAHGWRVLVDQAPLQHRPDGSYFEQTTWYQAYSTDFYVHAIAWATHAGLAIPAIVRERTRAAAMALRAFAREDGTIPQCGDDDGGHLLPLAPLSAVDVSDVLARAALLFDDAALTVPGSAGRWALPWLDGPAALGRLEALEVAPPAAGGRASKVLRDGGWVVLRERGEAPAHDHHLVLDAGPHGALSGGHAHADALSITLTARGVPLVVDPGTGAYTAPLRDRYRATRVHATVTVDGLDSSEMGTAFRWRTATDAHLTGAGIAGAASWADAWHDGYERLVDPVRHRRTIARLARRYWIMFDTLTCAAPHDLELALPCAPGSTVIPDGDRGAEVARAGVSLRVVGDGALAWSVEPRTVSPAYGAELPAPALVGRGRIARTTTIATVLALPDECDATALVRSGASAWRLDHARGSDRLLAPLGAAMHEPMITVETTWAALLDMDEATGPRQVVAGGAGAVTAFGRSVTLDGDGTVALDASTTEGR